MQECAIGGLPFVFFVSIGTMNRYQHSFSPTIGRRFSLPAPKAFGVPGEGRGEGESFERESRAVHGEGELVGQGCHAVPAKTTEAPPIPLLTGLTR
jgi:hypothetical protein